MTEFAGAAERALAASLVAQLPASTEPALRWRGVDLRPSAEHMLYGALRRPVAPPSVARARARSLARLVREAARGVGRIGRGRSHDAADIAVFVTLPVHATLFAPIGDHLPDRLALRIVDARTRTGRTAPLPGTDDRLAAHLDASHLPSLASHAIAAERHFAGAPDAWVERVGVERADQLTTILGGGLPLVALDIAHTMSFIGRRRPSVIACFSESGLLARTVPAAAAAAGQGTRVVDLPHAEAADPWGTVGAGYDAMAVYGPRAARVMAHAAIPAERVIEVGPLRYDALLSRPLTDPIASPRRIVLASQPGDPTKAAFHPEVKRTVLSAALAATATLRPAELVIVPHPTETDRVNEEFLEAAEIPDGVQPRIERPGTLHDVLPGAWVLITGPSQSVYDAVLSGVPAITVNATGGEDPVTFARDGIALGATSADETVALAHRLRNLDRRREMVMAARAAIGDRFGPLDGRSAARAADWLMTFVEGPAGGSAFHGQGQLESAGQ